MSTPLQRLAFAGLAAVYIGYRNFDRAVGVRTHPRPKADFLKLSTGADQIKWQPDNLTLTIEKITTDDNALKIAEVAANLSSTFEPGQEGQTDYLLGERYHAYFHVTRTIPVPTKFRPWLADLINYQPLRAMLSMFPPFGGEVPEVPKLTDNPVDEYGIGLLTPEQEYTKDRAIVDYRKSRLQSNVPLSGPIALGNVFVAASHCKIASNNRFVVRYVMMSTTELHALNGRVLWAQVYDKQAGTTMFYAVGAGQHSLPFLDRMNNHTAGHVFSTMHTSFAKVLTMADTSGGVQRLTDGVTERVLSQELLIAQGDKALAARRALASTFDIFSRMIALIRADVGMDVTGVPSTDTTEQDFLALPIPKDLDM